MNDTATSEHRAAGGTVKKRAGASYRGGADLGQKFFDAFGLGR